MSTETQKVDVLSILSVSSLLIRNLPELPGYNGSILTIDDSEAQRISRDLDAARAAVAQLIGAARTIDDNIILRGTSEGRTILAALARIGGAA